MAASFGIDVAAYLRRKRAAVTFYLGRRVRVPLVAGVLFTLMAAGRAAAADVCVIVDETRDTFSRSERAAAVLLIERQFELAGERIVPPGCANTYVVSHVQFGSTITVTLSGPQGQRDAVARGMDDVPAVYSQMVRSLLRGEPMGAPGVVDRTNVTRQQSDAPNRVYSDSLLYARLGYGGVFGDRAYDGPSVGMLGYRRELDSFGVDVSFFNFQYKSSNGSYDYYGGGSSGSTGSWLKLEFLRFVSPLSDRSLYMGGGLSWSTVNLDNGSTHWDGSGLQGEVTAGYELGRASSIRVFVQADAGLPFYKVHSHSYMYSNSPPYVIVEQTGRRFAPSLALSLGIGWQRGGK
jgi:hypothetical protein